MASCYVQQSREQKSELLDKIGIFCPTILSEKANDCSDIVWFWPFMVGFTFSGSLKNRYPSGILLRSFVESKKWENFQILKI